MESGAMRFILASSSPRRSELLKTILNDFEIIHSQAIEITESEYPDVMARNNALAKARDIAGKNPDAIVFGFDTVVVHDYKILGKPVDIEHARRMLSSLSGEAHVIITGYALVHLARRAELTGTVFSTVRFNRLGRERIDAYVEEFRPLDKAGSYGIQEIPEEFVDILTGSHSNVMGLPVEEFRDILEEYLAEIAEEIRNSN